MSPQRGALNTLGEPLRGRATLPSPLRGLVPAGGYPSRLRSLRSLRAHACTVVPETITVTLTTMLTMLVVLVVQKPDRRAGHGPMSPGASLRDRATLPSPLRGPGPSGGYPSRLHSLRSFRASLGRRLAALTAVCPTADADATFTGVVRPVAAVVSCSRFAHRPSHFVLRRCRLRRAPGSAPRPALVSARVRTLPPPPSAACCARLPAAPPATPATHSPWRLHSAGFAGVDSPFALPRIPGCFYALRRVVLTPDASMMLALPWPPMPAIGWSAC